MNIGISIFVLLPIKVLLSLFGYYNYVKNNPFTFVILAILISLIGGFGGSFMHNYIYGSDVKKLIVIYLFWFIQTFMWWITHSIIPPEAQHISNNFVAGLEYLFSSSGVVVFVIIFLIFVNIILFGMSLSKTYRGFIKRLAVIR